MQLYKIIVFLHSQNGSVAQLYRALHYGCRGLRLESLRGHKGKRSNSFSFFLQYILKLSKTKGHDQKLGSIPKVGHDPKLILFNRFIHAVCIHTNLYIYFTPLIKVSTKFRILESSLSPIDLRSNNFGFSPSIRSNNSFLNGSLSANR